jgi:hypothetical protein
MKTVTVTFPIEEAVDLIRLARAESRCLIENGDCTPDIDVLKRAQTILSARERIVTALEEIASVEEEPAPLPQYALDLTNPSIRKSVPDETVDAAVEKATVLVGDLVDEPDESLAVKHGVRVMSGGWQTM